MSFYSQEEIESLGFRFIGKNIKLSKKASIYNPSNISINDNSRIDDFCVLSAGVGGIEIGRNVHIAVFCSLIGNGRITIEDYGGLSSRTSIYSSNDDYSGNYLTNPTISVQFTNVDSNPVHLKKHVIVGSGSVILPGVIISQGVSIAALSLVNKSLDEFGVYGGVPVRKIKERSRNLLDLEKKYTNSQKKGSQ